VWLAGQRRVTHYPSIKEGVLTMLGPASHFRAMAPQVGAALARRVAKNKQGRLREQPRCHQMFIFRLRRRVVNLSLLTLK
jgi:hypothetical protein